MIISFRIGNALVLPVTRQVFVAGVEQKLGGRAFDLLLALASHADRVVSKDVLYELVWHDSAVEPNNLQVQVWALRRLLGGRSIATVPRRGYRLTLPVQAVALGTRPPALPSSPALDPAAEEALRQLIEQALLRLQASRWVTLVASDPAVREQAVRAVRQAGMALTVTTWHWRRDQQAAWDAELWRRVSAADGLVVAQDLDEDTALWLRERTARSAMASPRILASSDRALPDVADTLLQVSSAAALAALARRTPFNLPPRWPRRGFAGVGPIEPGSHDSAK